MRFEEDRKTHVAFRHGQVVERVPREFLKRFELRRLLVIVLRRVSLIFKA